MTVGDKVLLDTSRSQWPYGEDHGYYLVPGVIIEDLGDGCFEVEWADGHRSLASSYEIRAASSYEIRAASPNED